MGRLCQPGQEAATALTLGFCSPWGLHPNMSWPPAAEIQYPPHVWLPKAKRCWAGLEPGSNPKPEPPLWPPPGRLPGLHELSRVGLTHYPRTGPLTAVRPPCPAGAGR